MRPKAVLDTNILVRGALTPQGATARLNVALERRLFQLVTSEPLLEEFASTMQQPQVQRFARWSQQHIVDYVAAIRGVARVMPGRYAVDVVRTDAKDNPVVACALEAAADYIVTDDRRDLLPLKAIRISGHEIIQIVRPTAFLRLIMKRR